MTRMIKQLMLGLCFIIPLHTPVHAEENGGLIIEHAWIREAPPSVSMLAGYLVIKNQTDKDVTLICANSPAFSSVEIHASVIEDGIAKMRHLNEIFIPAGSDYQLEPGGYHLMMMGKEQPVKMGDEIPIELIFVDHDNVTTQAVVRRIKHTTE